MNRNMLKVVAREIEEGERGWWWLSFIDPRKPEGERFLGVAIVEGYGIATAALNAVDLKCNPGGEVAGCRIDADAVPAKFRNRLLDKREAQRFAG